MSLYKILPWTVSMMLIVAIYCAWFYYTSHNAHEALTLFLPAEGVIAALTLLFKY